MDISYRFGSLDWFFGRLDHVVAEESKSKVVVRSDDTGECADYGHGVEQGLENLGAFHLTYCFLNLFYYI